MPELASIRLAAYEEGGKLIGHRVLPVVGLCPGYRHVTLRNELSQPLLMTSLFLLVVVKVILFIYCLINNQMIGNSKINTRIEK